jgi:branched-chain amino acid transport system ATP-binding protein
MQDICSSSYLLKVNKLSVSFGGLMALNGISAEFKKNELCSIVGPNGAGKTTFFNLLTGLYKVTSGDIIFGDTLITQMAPDKIFRLGIVRTFQTPSIFPELSVLKNVEIAAQGKYRRTNAPWGKLTMRPNKIKEKAENFLNQLKLIDFSNKLAGSLTYGDKRRLEIAMGLVCEPKLLLLDEPTAGMGLEEAEQTKALLKKISQELTIILIEHDMNLVMNISERIIVFNFGKILKQGTPDEIINDAEVKKIYMGDI